MSDTPDPDAARAIAGDAKLFPCPHCAGGEATKVDDVRLEYIGRFCDVNLSPEEKGVMAREIRVLRRQLRAARAARADERENCLGAYSRHRKLGDKSTRCPKCDGWGWWVKDTHDGQGAMIECMVCDGTGHVVEEPPAAIRARGQQGGEA